MIIRNNITLEQVQAELGTHVFYSSHTCWWTHQPQDLWLTNRQRQIVPVSTIPREQRVGEGGAPLWLPCDCQGAPLLQTTDPQGFLNYAITNQAKYGPHGLRAFMAMHAQNCFRVGVLPQVGTQQLLSYASPSVQEYTLCLDQNGVSE